MKEFDKCHPTGKNWEAQNVGFQIFVSFLYIHHLPQIKPGRPLQGPNTKPGISMKTAPASPTTKSLKASAQD